jgi:hypothetical protein
MKDHLSPHASLRSARAPERWPFQHVTAPVAGP